MTLDLPLGTVHIIAGVYDSARALGLIPEGGLLVTGRVLLEPIGPVGLNLSTRDTPPFFRRRLLVGLDLLGLLRVDSRDRRLGNGADFRSVGTNRAGDRVPNGVEHFG